MSDFGGDFAIPFQEALIPALTNDLVLRPPLMQDSCCKLQLLRLQRQGWPNKACSLHNFELRADQLAKSPDSSCICWSRRNRLFQEASSNLGTRQPWQDSLSSSSPLAPTVVRPYVVCYISSQTNPRKTETAKILSHRDKKKTQLSNGNMMSAVRGRTQRTATQVILHNNTKKKPSTTSKVS